MPEPAPGVVPERGRLRPLPAGQIARRRRQLRSVLQPGRAVSVEPSFGCGEFGSTFSIAPPLLAEILERHYPAVLDARGPMFPLDHVGCSPRAYLLQGLLIRSLRSGGPPDRLLVEETAFELVEEVVARPLAKPARSDPREARISREVVEEVKSQLLCRLETGISLQELAGKLGFSPYRVWRHFKEGTGLTVHHYLNRLRLRTALAPILEHSPLSHLAFDLGFSSHSHFTSSFRREFGVTPSAVRSATYWTAMSSGGRD